MKYTYIFYIQISPDLNPDYSALYIYPNGDVVSNSIVYWDSCGINLSGTRLWKWCIL